MTACCTAAEEAEEEAKAESAAARASEEAANARAAAAEEGEKQAKAATATLQAKVVTLAAEVAAARAGELAARREAAAATAEVQALQSQLEAVQQEVKELKAAATTTAACIELPAIRVASPAAMLVSEDSFSPPSTPHKLSEGGDYSMRWSSSSGSDVCSSGPLLSRWMSFSGGVLGMGCSSASSSRRGSSSNGGASSSRSSSSGGASSSNSSSGGASTGSSSSGAVSRSSSSNVTASWCKPLADVQLPAIGERLSASGTQLRNTFWGAVQSSIGALLLTGASRLTEHINRQAGPNEQLGFAAMREGTEAQRPATLPPRYHPNMLPLWQIQAL